MGERRMNNITHQGVKYNAIDSDSVTPCDDCDLLTKTCLNNPLADCVASTRSDFRDIIWKEAKDQT